MSEILNCLQSGELPMDYNWNCDGTGGGEKYISEPSAIKASKVQIVSEDLRDGLHGVSEHPEVGAMVDYVGKMRELGIKVMTVGIYPGDGNKIDRSIKSLLGVMANDYSDVVPIVLTQATQPALDWLEKCKAINPKTNAIIFMGSAPSRMIAEGWSEDFVLDKIKWATNYATEKLGVDVVGATEHTTQTPPDFLKKIISAQVENGAKYFCAADTIGIARPFGAFRLVKFIKNTLHEMKADEVAIDWHGHRDTGNALGNAMAAVAAGADRVHTVARGIGERAGNIPLEEVMINLDFIAREGGLRVPWNMKMLTEVLNSYGGLVNEPTPIHGVLADRAFTTSLGIHSAAMRKAKILSNESGIAGNPELQRKFLEMSRKIYSAIDPDRIGRTHDVRVSQWSGSSTVKMAAEQLGYDVDNITDSMAQQVLDTAKQYGRELSSTELKAILDNRLDG